MIRTAMYARISQDRHGDGLSIERQRADCEKVAADRQWAITGEYVDNDISAYSGKLRPGFEAMLADIEAGQFDAVVAYHQDRLTRRPAEFETFLATCQRAGVKLFATARGDTNIGEGDGIMTARIYAAVAANQSDAASRRIKRKNEERAAAGMPHVTGQRAYGYELDKMTVVESEAIVIRKLVSKFLAGDSLISLARWLQAEGIKTATGKHEWRVPTVRNLLWTGRIAGLLERNGELVGPGKWPAIITVAQHEQIRHRLTQNAQTKRRSPRRYLLAGKVYCGACGTKMVSSPDGDRTRYGCRKGPDHGGCNKVFIAGGALDDLIADAVLTRLDAPELAKALAEQPDDDAEAVALTRQIVADTEHKNQLAQAFGQRLIDQSDWFNALKPIVERLEVAKMRLGRLNSHNGLAQHVGNGAKLREAWTTPEMTLQTQAAIVASILDRVIILPATQRSNRLDVSRVRPVWSL
ncbi:serine recombinase [Aeromicrobium sp. A1-2]|uniref:recombinase family protein n=1 Tax=Aeromicrobium sp. A1-2 TaxID=2107713 RepID=UPI000E4C4224|nr:recombinase family protein [Aeromicrobium sp. A1-2]AXT83816.1 serine recombinase [Aeromicrobium sp. A1-2]